MSTQPVILTFGEIIQDVISLPVGPLVYGGGHVDGQIKYFRGGCGPNVAAGCAQLGATSRFLGHHGDDFIGTKLVDQLRHAGVEVAPIKGGTTASSLSIATPDGDTALMFSPGGSRSTLVSDIEPAAFEDVAIVHMNSHHLYSDETRAAFWEVVRQARSVGALVTLDVSASNRLSEYGIDQYREDLRHLMPNFLFANKAEAQVLDIINQYPGDVGTVVIHRGSEPTILANGRKTLIEVPVQRVPGVIDTTGAGDAFAAGFLVGQLRKASLVQSTELAHDLAAQVIVQIGAEFDVERSHAAKAV